jgi:hypothetical protein
MSFVVVVIVCFVILGIKPRALPTLGNPYKSCLKCINIKITSLGFIFSTIFLSSKPWLSVIFFIPSLLLVLGLSCFLFYLTLVRA